MSSPGPAWPWSSCFWVSCCERGNTRPAFRLVDAKPLASQLSQINAPAYGAVRIGELTEPSHDTNPTLACDDLPCCGRNRRPRERRDRTIGLDAHFHLGGVGNTCDRFEQPVWRHAR